MATYNPSYRLTVYAARSVDPTEATVLTPIAGAVHSNPFQIITLQGVTGWKPYMGLPSGRRGRLDPLTKRTDVGSITIPILDYKAGANQDQLTRWVTAFIGDASGQSRLLGLKVYVEESVDGGVTWSSFWTGRIESVRLQDPLTYSITVSDMARDMQLPVFVGKPHASASNAQQPSLLPVGLMSAFGNYQVTQKLGATVSGSTTRVVGGVTYRQSIFSLDSTSLARVDNIYTDELAASIPAPVMRTVGQGVGMTAIQEPNFTGPARLNITTSSGGTGDLIIGTAYLQPLTGTPTRYRVTGFYARELMRQSSTFADPPNYIACPTTVGATISFYVQTDRNVAGANPIVINDTHPVQVWKDLLDGYYGYLWKYPERLPGTTAAYGDVKRKIAYSTALFSTGSSGLIGDATYPTARFIITERARLDEWVEKNILQPYQLGFYLSSSGAVTPVDLRRPTTAPSLTIADADLVEGPQFLGWQQDRSSSVTRVLATYYQDWPLGDAISKIESGEAERGPSGNPKMASMFRPVANSIEVLDVGRSDLGEVELQIDAQGFRGMPNEAMPTTGTADRLQTLQDRLKEFVVALQQPYGAGAQVTTLRCRRTSNTNGCNPGDLRLLQVNALPDPSTNLRGGTRIARCVERSEEGLVVVLTFVDLGVNVTASAPTLGIPSLTAGSTRNSVDVLVTLNASTQPARIDYALTSSTVATVPSTSDATWTMGALTQRTTTVTMGRLSAGSRVWVRGRTEPDAFNSLQTPSSWVQAGTSGYVDLATLPGPSALSVGSIDGYRATPSWTNGSSGFQTQVRLAVPSTDSLTAVATVIPGQTSYRLIGLAQNSSYTVAVRHMDGIGGFSTEASAIFSTLAASTTAPKPKALTVLRGN